MSISQKAELLVSIVVRENCCPWEIFQENVKTSSGGDKAFRDKLKTCNTKEELVDLVNQYI